MVLFSVSDEEKVPELMDTSAEHTVEVVTAPGDENEAMRKNDTFDQKPIRPTESETRFTREITSVMMTTSGFISPAREGKLPDAKAPIIPVAEIEKPPVVKEPPSAAVGTLLANSVNGVKSEKVKGEKIKTEKVKTKKKSLQAAVLHEKMQEKKRKKEKALKDPMQEKLSPMGPPPAKQMPPQPSPIFLPNDTPMSAIAEQQKIGKKPFLPKIPRKHKVKDPNKPPKSVLDGKVKKPKKPPKNKNLAHVLDELFKVNQPTFPTNTVPSNNATMDIKHDRSDSSIDLTEPSNVPPNSSPMQPLPPFPPNQQPNFFEGKLSTEPDKGKLNIFKRISSKKKEDAAAAKQALQLPPNINLPETSIFPVDDSGMPPAMPSPSLPVNLQVPPKKTPKKSPTMSAKKLMKQLGNDIPLNMTVPKPGENVEFPMLMTPKQIKAAARKQMKALKEAKEPKEPKEKKVRVKKEKVKAKDKKLKDQPWPMSATDLSIGGPSPIIPPPQHSPLPSPQQPVTPRKSDPIPPMLQNLYDQHLNQQFAHLRGNLGNMGNLRGAEFMQNFPMYPWSGPGLIPGNPLFPNFPLQPRQRLPFPLPNFDMFGTFPRLKRPHLEKPEPEPMAMPINYEMAQCNVAPLVPASLKLEDISTPITSQANSLLSSSKHSFPSSTSVSLVPSNSSGSHQSTKSKPLTPEPRLDSQTIDLTDDPYDDHSPISKRIESPFDITSPRSDNPSQMSQHGNKRRLSSSPPPRHTSSSFNLDDTQSLSDMDDGDNGSSKEKTSKGDKRKEKEHKKEKKDKEGKIKKKKDKKDKTKSKEKSDKKKDKEEKLKEKELKLKTKKEKKEKRKEKELARVLCGMANNPPLVDLGVSSPGSDSSIVPKLTLKLGASPRPDTPDLHRKM